MDLSFTFWVNQKPVEIERSRSRNCITYFCFLIRDLQPRTVVVYCFHTVPQRSVLVSSRFSWATAFVDMLAYLVHPWGPCTTMAGWPSGPLHHMHSTDPDDLQEAEVRVWTVFFECANSSLQWYCSNNEILISTFDFWLNGEIAS